MNIGIIGGLGIGKAHAIAAMRAGHVVKWVHDLPENKEKIIKTYNNEGKGYVLNEWGFIRETGFQENPIKFSEDPILDAHSVDLTIVATPDLTHAEWARKLENLPCLIEKPALINSLDYSQKTFVGYSWLNHSKIDYPSEYIIMFHKWPPTHRLNNVITDLGSHLLSILCLEGQESQLVACSKNCVMLMQDDVYAIGLYLTENLFDITIKGKKLSLWNDEGVDTIIDDKPLVWEDLFGKQINNVLNLENKLVKMQPNYKYIDDTLMTWLLSCFNNSFQDYQMNEIIQFLSS